MIVRGPAPNCLGAFQATGDGPKDWESFRNERTCFRICQENLVKSQGGLCAYCEIDVRIPRGSEPRSWDSQIEHISPKSSDGQHVFDWNNLLGCCRGGISSSHVKTRGHTRTV